MDWKETTKPIRLYESDIELLKELNQTFPERSPADLFHMMIEQWMNQTEKKDEIANEKCEMDLTELKEVLEELLDEKFKQWKTDLQIQISKNEHPKNNSSEKKEDSSPIQFEPFFKWD